MLLGITLMHSYDKFSTLLAMTINHCSMQFNIIVFLLSGVLCSVMSHGQASIHEGEQTLKTYDYSDPNPVPVLATNPKIYPYFKYEGYALEGVDRKWKVITLENSYIQVFVLPEVGGKVWGAIEKSTGEEFIYRNEVMKFRNIAMRGPWTSGGIEFNFGIIGHHPSTASPVDYRTSENDDGSVSCFVGSIDLPSRTQWRVEIRLPADAAYFETRVVWYNPTDLPQSYYNWMTAAAVAREDLTFYCPGNAYLDHPGNKHPWPIDNAGRNLSHYTANDFGGSKSYHVVGVYDDFFGGYYSDRDFGFGHWAPYEEMPGQKLWLWAQSRSGAIWEDLLTDDDGQYIEFQAGRLFNQYSPGGDDNPIAKVDFEPGRTDIWREIWFPVKKIGGITDVSTKGVLHVEETPDSMIVGINALQPSEGVLEILDDRNEIISSAQIKMEPMDLFRTSLPKTEGEVSIRIPAMELFYEADAESAKVIDRPFDRSRLSDSIHLFNPIDGLMRESRQLMSDRNFWEARDLIDSILKINATHLEALITKSELFYRSGQSEMGRDVAQLALSIDTYDPRANFIAGLHFRALGDHLNALECLGWAARSLAFRAESYANIAEIYLAEKDLAKASQYARNALDYNRFHFRARQVLAVVARLRKNQMSVLRQHEALSTIDPLNHFVPMERYFFSKEETDKKAAVNSHRSELPFQTMIELAANYYRLGLFEDALEVLDLAPQNALVDLWWIYLSKKLGHEEYITYLADLSSLDPTFIFPFRRETLPMLEWGVEENNLWQLKYFLALHYWHFGRLTEAHEMLEKIDSQVHHAHLYLTKAALKRTLGLDPLKDLQQAVLTDKDNWRSWQQLIQYHSQNHNDQRALLASEEAFERMPDNYSLGMEYARALLHNERYQESVATLKGLQVLPFEGAYGGRVLWEQAHLGAAIESISQQDYSRAKELLLEGKEWPENLGVGKPYDPDDRRFDYLLAHVELKTNNKGKAQDLQQAFLNKFIKNKRAKDLDQVLALKMMTSFDRDQITQDLSLAGHDDTKEGAWMLAIMNKDSHKISELEKANPSLFGGLQYEILKMIVLLD